MELETMLAAPAPDDDPLNRLQVYRLAIEALHRAQLDVVPMRRDRVLHDVASQLVRAAGSIAANVAEGYSRGGTSDRRKFFEYALGSARECAVWYEASGHPELEERLARLTSVRRLLLTMIRNARENTARDRRSFRP